MKRLTTLVLTLAALAGRAQAAPQEVIDSLCRTNLMAGVHKLGRDTLKQLGKCHSQRLNGQLPASTDCNLEVNAPWADLRESNEDSLRLRAYKRCTVPPAASPDEMGFSSCPAPCDYYTPSIQNYFDATECLICQTFRITESLSGVVFGTPSLPAGDEEPCWARLTRVVRHYIGVVLKAQRSCKMEQEQADIGPEVDCRTYDPKGRVATAVELVHAGVAYCSDADVAALDSCSDTQAALAPCLIDEINAGTFALFDTIY
jgi:hypothetical protein